MLSARQEREQQILSLYSDLQEVENEIAMRNAERDNLREKIGLLVAKMDGQKAIIPGVARMELTAPSVSKSYDRGAVDALIQKLITADQWEIAHQLIACQKESHRAGSLRITAERKK